MAKVVELFKSAQGEGLFLGYPSTFLRLFGCNFTCSGFSNPSGELPPIVLPEDVISVQQLDGNSFTKGCDSRYAWDPAYKHLAKDYTADQLAATILAEYNAPHLVITGGEPMMQSDNVADLIHALILHDKQQEIQTITFETNCSKKMSEKLVVALRAWSRSRKDVHVAVLFSNSPKLAVSGEAYKRRVRPNVLQQQVQVAADCHYNNVLSTFKFVVGTEDDIGEAQAMLDELRQGIDAPDNMHHDYHHHLNTPMLMPLGATVEQYEDTLRHIAELAVKYDFKITPRLHLNIWGNKVGT